MSGEQSELDGYRGELGEYQGEPSEYQGEPCGYQGEPSEYQDEPCGYQGELIGYRREPSEYQGEPGEYRDEPDEYIHEHKKIKIALDELATNGLIYPADPLPDHSADLIAYDEIQRDIQGAEFLSKEEYKRLITEVYEFYTIKFNPKGSYYNLNCRISKDYIQVKNRIRLHLESKYLMMANYFQVFKNDSARSKQFYLLAIKLKNRLAMYVYAKAFYFNADFNKAKVLLIMAIKQKHVKSLKELRRLFETHLKSLTEYYLTLKEISQSVELININQEIDRVESIINQGPPNLN